MDVNDTGDFVRRLGAQRMDADAFKGQRALDKDNFTDVLKAQKLALDLSVPNRLEKEDSDDNLAVSLKFESLADFEPDAIVEKVPELKSILELREALKALKGPLGNIPDFRKKLQSLVSDEGSRAKLLTELGLDKK